jgi:hypothetical protein
LFRDQNAPAASVFSDPATLGFTVDSGALLIQDLVGDALRVYAETVASWAVQNHLADIASCTTMDSACRRQVISSFGKRAFRSPLPTARIDKYETLFAAEASFSSGVEAVVVGDAAVALLPLPHRARTGRRRAGIDGHPHALRGGEQPSYLLIGSMPDDQMMQAADTAAAAAPRSRVDAQAARLMADPRVQDSVMRFATGWMYLERLGGAKDAAFVTITDANRADMLVRRGPSSSTRSRPDAVHAADGELHVPQQQRGAVLRLPDHRARRDDVHQVQLHRSAMRDPGILGQGALLTGLATARTSSPTQRGKLVRARFLCQPIPPPPPGVNTNLPPPAANQSTRALYEAHVDYTNTNRTCPGCHTSWTRSASASSTTTGSASTARWTTASPWIRAASWSRRPMAATRPSTASASWRRTWPETTT